MVGGLAEVPVYRGGRDPLLHMVVVEKFAATHTAQVRQARPVPHDVPDSDLSFTVSAEFAPVLGHGRVVIDQSPISEAVDHSGCHALGRREHHRRGVRRPGRPAASIRPSGPDIHHRLSIEIDRQSATAKTGMWEKTGESAYCTGEAGISGTMNPAGQGRTAATRYRRGHDSEFTSQTRCFGKSLSIR